MVNGQIGKGPNARGRNGKGRNGRGRSGMIPTFAQRWVKYQESKLFGQFDPTMGKTYANIGQ